MKIQEQMKKAESELALSINTADVAIGQYIAIANNLKESQKQLLYVIIEELEELECRNLGNEVLYCDVTQELISLIKKSIK